MVATPLNHRWDHRNKQSVNEQHDDNDDDDGNAVNEEVVEDEKENADNVGTDTLDLVISRDILHEFDAAERKMVWEHREVLRTNPEALNVFLRCVDWRDPMVRSEAYHCIETWALKEDGRHLPLEDALELLSYEFMDTVVREWAVMRISEMPDNELQIYLLQLVQCLKYGI